MECGPGSMPRRRRRATPTYSAISIASSSAQRTSGLSYGALVVLKVIPVMAGSLFTTQG